MAFLIATSAHAEEICAKGTPTSYCVLEETLVNREFDLVNAETARRAEVAREVKVIQERDQLHAAAAEDEKENAKFRLLVAKVCAWHGVMMRPASELCDWYRKLPQPQLPWSAKR